MMEMEDPLSVKFRSIIEALMAKTTSELAKVFADIILETRMEISRSWKEIDELRQVLEQRETRLEECSVRNQMTQVTFKIEEEDAVVSEQSPAVPESTESGGEMHLSKDATVEEMDTRQDSVSVPVQATLEMTIPELSVPAAQVTQLETRHKNNYPSASHAVSKLQTSETKNTELPNSSIQTVSVVSPQLSSSTDTIILCQRSQEKGAVVSKVKGIQNKISTESNSVKHKLRDRFLLSSQKPCLCCTSDQCQQQQNEANRKSPVVSSVYACPGCGTEFQERTAFESHKCSSGPKCCRCGQTFTSLRILANHSRRVSPTFNKPFPYKCYLCDHMFATRCGWNIHKRIHAHGHVSEIEQQDIPSPSHSFPVNKELKAKVEVRLERISEAQLEAALFPKMSMLQDDQNSGSSVELFKNLSPVKEPTPSTGSSNQTSSDTTTNAPMVNTESMSNSYSELPMECQAANSGTISSECARQADDGTEDSVASRKNQPAEKRIRSKSLIASRVDSMACDEGSSSASEDFPKGFNSLSQKQKMSDCNHDIYNGVFPVEKILRWRKTKGQNEVRIKWMPCSLCGAKWKNTWEPAESFVSYKNGKNKGGKKNKQK